MTASPDRPLSRRRYAAFTAIAVVLALVGTVLGFELVLQGLAWMVGTTGRDPVTQWAGGKRRVLMVGDSNTYGLFLPPEESYPAQFEALWNQEVESPKIEVINLGYPGTNSSVLLRNLPKMLETFQPDLLTVMIGANDFWTDVVDSEEPQDDLGQRVSHWLRENSRVYKLLHMLRRSLEGPVVVDTGERNKIANHQLNPDDLGKIAKALAAPEIDAMDAVRSGDETFDLGYVRGTSRSGDAKDLQRNLVRIIDEAKKYGTKVVLLTYPSHSHLYLMANRELRGVARATNTTLVDISLALSLRCAKAQDCPDLYFPDEHARKPGYTIVARTLRDYLRNSPILAP